MAVYFISDGLTAKIGFTDRAVTDRLRELQTGNPRSLEIVGVIESGTMATESAIHRNWWADSVRGEWFKDSPALRDRFQRIQQQRMTVDF
jgi:hypothetical protein